MTATSLLRQPVFDALASVPEPVWLVLVYALRSSNRIFGMVRGTNPASVQLLDAACTAEILRIETDRV